MRNEYLESEKMLAEFMGAKVTQDYPENTQYPQLGKSYMFDFFNCEKQDKPPIYDRYCTDVRVKYSSSFDWLMPVWRKFMSLVIDKFDEAEYSYWRGKAAELLLGCHLESFYKVVVAGVEWYNEQKK